MSLCLTQVPTFSPTHPTTRVFATRGEGGIYVENPKGFWPILLDKKHAHSSGNHVVSECCLNIPTNKNTTQTCCSSPTTGLGIYIANPNGAQGKYSHLWSKKHVCFWEISHLCLKQQLLLFSCKATATQTCVVDQRWGVLILKTLRLFNLNTCCMVYEDRRYIQKLLTCWLSWRFIKFNICGACWLLETMVKHFRMLEHLFKTCRTVWTKIQQCLHLF